MTENQVWLSLRYKENDLGQNSVLEHAFSVHWALPSIPSIRERENHWEFIYFKIGYQYAAWTGLKLIILLRQPPWVLQLQTCATMPGSVEHNFMKHSRLLTVYGEKKICLYVCVIAKSAIDDHGNSSYRSIFLGSSKILKKNSFDVFFVIIMDRKLVLYLLLLPWDKQLTEAVREEALVFNLTPEGLSTAGRVGTGYGMWLDIVYIVQTRKQKQWLE